MKIEAVSVGPLQTNCYLVTCPETLASVIIDPGWSGEELSELVVDNGFDLKALLLTHAHFDHVAGAAALKRLTGVPVLAHADSAPLLLDNHRHASFWGFRIEPAPGLDGELAEGQIVQVGRLALEVLCTPGHAPGHVCFYERAAKTLFDGDVLFQGGIGRFDLPGGDYSLLMQSIQEKLLTLPDDTAVYPGHGPATTIGDERRWNPYLRDLQTRYSG
jgi:hydroxyacylglutathione hydrolase